MDTTISKYHQMESNFRLFDLGKNEDLPIWDLIRVDMYYRYVYNYASNNNISGYTNLLYGSWPRTIWVWIKSLPLFFKRNKIVFYSRPRDVRKDGKAYDKILNDMITTCPEDQRLIIGGISHKGQISYNYYNINLLIYVLKLFIRKYDLHKDWVYTVIAAFKSTYNVEIAPNDVIRLVNYNILQTKALFILFKWLKPRKIFSSDPFKPIYAAAKKLGIQTYEFQHAGIFFDYLAYSYPAKIISTSNIAWANNYVTFGTKWGINNNIPASIINLGNNEFKPVLFNRPLNENYYLVISDDEHNNVLRPIALELSKRLEDSIIIYKLHPSEYNNISSYQEYFEGLSNVIIATNEYPLFDLIKYMNLMVLVYSSAFFEAISLNKKVAVLKHDTYYLLNDFVDAEPNAKIVESIDDIIKFDKIPEMVCESSYYDSFNQNVAKKMLL